MASREADRILPQCRCKKRCGAANPAGGAEGTGWWTEQGRLCVPD